MADIFKPLGNGVMAAAEAAATVVSGANTVPASTRWNCKVIIFNTGASARTVTCGFHPSDASLVAGEFLMNAESLASKGRREFGLRSFAAGSVFRANQASGTDVQWEVVGIEQDV